MSFFLAVLRLLLLWILANFVVKIFFKLWRGSKLLKANAEASRTAQKASASDRVFEAEYKVLNPKKP